jgi:cellulose synthase/poly-beta-1,6-N-acetylglucosamine synthase-like glycosyltransferase
MILAVFVTGMVLLWVSVFGYPLALAVIRRRRAAEPPAVALPDVAIVVPTLNEEALIAAKLEDLARTDYPTERLTFVVVDGGSTDRTCAIVESAIERGQPVRLMRVPPPTAQADQVCRALATLPHDLVVLTDADTRLEPGCIRALVTELVRDPQLAVVGPRCGPTPRCSRSASTGGRSRGCGGSKARRCPRRW